MALSSTTKAAILAANLSIESMTLPRKPSFDSLIDKTLLKIEVMIMSLAFAFALIGNLMVIFTLMFRRYVKKHLNNNNNNNNNAAGHSNYYKTSGAINSQYQMYQAAPTKSRRSKFTRMNFFILNLSIADVYVSLGNILTMLLWRMNNNLFYAGDLACRAVAYFQLVSVYYSTYVLITMTIDRYEAICKPLIGLGYNILIAIFKQINNLNIELVIFNSFFFILITSIGWSKTRGFVYICVAFVLSHLQGIPQIIFFSLRTVDQVEPPVKTCFAVFDPMWLQSSYIMYTFLMQFLIPLSIIIGCCKSFNNHLVVNNWHFEL
jgi:hypothetical protein